jgi:GNAT superfamily N-acetyltransferase
MSNLADLIGVRHMLPADRDYVTHTWLHNYATYGLGVGGIDREVLFRCHRQIVHRLLDKHTTAVAYDPNDTRIILGFLCGDTYPSAALVHFAYVRRRFRKRGIAQMLLEQLGWLPGQPIMSTHNTFDGKSVAQRKPVLYNPYLQQAEFAGGLRGRTTRGIEEE